MKKSERRFLLILVIIAIIVIAVLLKVRNGKKSNENSNNPQNSEVEAVDEKFVQVQDDGTKLNVSNKLSETKKFENYEISNIRLTEKDGQSLILADVKNVGDKKVEVTLIDITILDEEGKEIAIIGGIIGDVEPGQTVQLNAAATTDFANAYDFSVKVSESNQ